MHTRTLRLLFGSIMVLVFAGSLPAYAEPSIPSPPSAQRDPYSRVSSTGEILPPATLMASLHEDVIQVPAANGMTKLIQRPSPPQGAPTFAADDLTPQYVIGPDGRVQTADTRVFPASAVVFVENDLGLCSGWLYDDDTVATAAHCLHRDGRFAGITTVTPGRNGTSKPFPSCLSKSLHILQGWISTGSPAYDFGAIKLNCTVGQMTGNFGMKSETRFSSTFVKGYPGDKPFGTQWGDRGTSSWSAFTGLITIDNDVVEGNSGGPVYYTFPDCTPCGFALVQGQSRYGTPTNYAKVIDTGVFNAYQSWR